MQKIKMSRGVTLTFEEGCKKYLENCRQRNLREGTIRLFRKSPRSEALPKRLLQRDDGSHRRGQQPHGWYDRCCCSCDRRGF